MDKLLILTTMKKEEIMTKIKTRLKPLLVLLIVLGLSNPLFAQDDGKEPVRFPFETTVLLNHQTIKTPFKGGLNFMIQHRFGPMDNGISDIFGVYASANSRLALNYGITDRIMVGLGTTRDRMLQDLQWKYVLLQQTQDGSIPLFITYYGNMVLNASDKSNFGAEENYRFIHRLSYFTEFIFARKFNDVLSLQLAPSVAYFNAVDPGYSNLNMGISAGGRARVFGFHSIIFEYAHPLTTHEGTDDNPDPETFPNIALGMEFATGTHAFQVFVSNYSRLNNQYNLAFNENDPFDGDFRVGFNITVRF